MFIGDSSVPCPTHVGRSVLRDESRRGFCRVEEEEGILCCGAKGERGLGCGIKQICGKGLASCKLNAGRRGFGGANVSKGSRQPGCYYSGEGKVLALLIQLRKICWGLPLRTSRFTPSEAFQEEVASWVPG